MTIPYLKTDELLALLKENGWDVVSDKYWESHSRLMLAKDGQAFPFQLSKKGIYYYGFVVRICESLGIEPPEEHRVVYEQLKALKADKPQDE